MKSFVRKHKASLICAVVTFFIMTYYFMFVHPIIIFDTDDFILRIEALLACGLYIPGLILAFSKVKEEIGKFLCVVVKYVLMILAMAAMVIIYLYIIV